MGMSYKAGIIEAIEELKERSGSSAIAIKKYMQAKLPKDKKWKNGMFLMALKNGVASGDFVQNKNSYKLSTDFKKKRSKASTVTKKKVTPKKSPKKKLAPKKKTLSKKTTSKKKPSKKKTTTKKKS